MIKVNLISRKKNVRVQKSWTKIISLGLFFSFCAYFLGVTLYVLISITILTSRIKRAETESVSISRTMLDNNEKLSRFVLTKLILAQVVDVNKKRFHYKEYLDEITAMLPASTTLSGVDFKVKGWLSLSIRADSIYPLSFLEKVLINKATWSDNKYFSGAYVESVYKGKDGAYYTRLQLEIKNNG